MTVHAPLLTCFLAKLAVGSDRGDHRRRGGSFAAVLVWENIWAAPFASAVRRSGGQLVASGRIPIQALLAAVEAEEQEEVVDEDTEQPAATEGALICLLPHDVWAAPG